MRPSPKGNARLQPGGFRNALTSHEHSLSGRLQEKFLLEVVVTVWGQQRPWARYQNEADAERAVAELRKHGFGARLVRHYD